MEFGKLTLLLLFHVLLSHGQNFHPCEIANCGLFETCQILKDVGYCFCIQGYKIGKTGSCVLETDPCDGFNCPTHMECRNDPSTGRYCVCKAGFVAPRNNVGGCVRQDPCTNVVCPIDSTTGVCVNGFCNCKPGFKKNANGVCVRENPNDACIGFPCPRNMVCISIPQFAPLCRCRTGFVQSRSGQQGCEQEVPTHPCMNVRCGLNSICANGQCICRQGFQRNAAGDCVFSCTGQSNLCPSNSRCISGECVCNAGFERRGMDCEPLLNVNACGGIACGSKQYCNLGRCICLPGFVPVPEGIECIRERGNWMNWQSWSACSASCGGGAQLRIRECDGNTCIGSPVQTMRCSEHAC